MNRFHQTLLVPLIAVVAVLLGLAESASAAFNRAATETHYGEILLWESEVSGELALQAADPTRGNGEWIYDGALGVPVYVRQNPWTHFDPLGLQAEKRAQMESMVKELYTMMNAKDMPPAFREKCQKLITEISGGYQQNYAEQHAFTFQPGSPTVVASAETVKMNQRASGQPEKLSKETEAVVAVSSGQDLGQDIGAAVAGAIVGAKAGQNSPESTPAPSQRKTVEYQQQQVEQQEGGIYEFPDQKAGGTPYVGQSQDLDSRLAQHEKSGRLSPGTASTTEVPGDKTAREIAEHKRIQEITGGQPASQSDAVSNKVDPIGQKRQHLLEEDKK